MSADDITPAGLLIAFAVLVLVVAAAGLVQMWRTRRRERRHAASTEEPVIDLTYLERAIQADADAATRRAAEDKPLFSRSQGRSADHAHRLPTDDG